MSQCLLLGTFRNGFFLWQASVWALVTWDKDSSRIAVNAAVGHSVWIGFPDSDLDCAYVCFPFGLPVRKASFSRLSGVFNGFRKGRGAAVHRTS